MRIFLLGASPSFDLNKAPTFDERLRQTSGNTGNQVIAYGLLKPLVVDAVDWSHAKGPAYVQDNFDCILIAAANFLHSGFDFGGMAAFIEQTKLPVAIVGLGAQSSTFDPRIELLPGTRRFVKVIAERCAKIGVRGKFTAEVLAELGVHNVQITGCPSFYMNGLKPEPIKSISFGEGTRVAINGSRDVLRHSFDAAKMRSALNGLMAEALRYDGIFVAQTEADEIAMADEPGSAKALTASEHFAAFYQSSGLDPERLRAWALRNCRVYWSVDRWLDDMRDVDFVAGTRFHGAVAALSVGAPAFVICHDTRTTEMCEFFGIPHADIRELDRIDLATLYARSDFASFELKRKMLTQKYIGFLNANNLKHRFSMSPAL